MTSIEENTFPDIWEWINGLPPPTEWKSDIMSVKLCGCPRVSLQFSAKPITDKREQLLLFALLADFQVIPINLWTSQPCNPRDSNTMFGTLLLDFINGILQYGPEPAAEANTMDATAIVREWRDKLRDMLNCAFVCMCLCVCVYEAPGEIRSGCLHVLEMQMQRVVNCCDPNARPTRYELKRFSHEWIEVEVQIDNVRCDIFQLASSGLMLKCGIPEEKHFPSKISVDITPPRTGILSMSLSKSSDNPAHELTSERTVEMGVEWPKAHADFKVAASEASAMSMKPWKMEQSGRGNVGTFEWILYDTTNGKEVAGSKPPKTAMYQHKAWFKDRYSNASKPFTRQGGVVFAGDKYSNSIIWRVRNDMEGKTLKWEVGGRIWVTYWPNKYKTSYSETRYVDFCEQVELPLLQQLIQ
eukprot:Gb_07189 [translate_table: standard]